MNQRLDMIDMELLISKVKENSAIYDASEINHNNRKYIASVWAKIGEELNISEELAKDKWHQLRSNYRRAKRVEKTGTKSKWLYYDYISFLDDFISRDSNVESPSQLVNHEIGSNENVPETNATTAAENIEITVTNNKFKRRTDSSTVYDADSSEFTNSKRRKEDEGDLYLSELRKLRADESDPDRMFLLSLLPSMKQLNPGDNMDFKLYTLQFMKEKLNPANHSWLQHQATSRQCPDRNVISPNSSTSHSSCVIFKEEIYSPDPQ